MSDNDRTLEDSLTNELSFDLDENWADDLELDFDFDIDDDENEVVDEVVLSELDRLDSEEKEKEAELSKKKEERKKEDVKHLQEIKDNKEEMDKKIKAEEEAMKEQDVLKSSQDALQRELDESRRELEQLQKERNDLAKQKEIEEKLQRQEEERIAVEEELRMQRIKMDELALEKERAEQEALRREMEILEEQEQREREEAERVAAFEKEKARIAKEKEILKMDIENAKLEAKARLVRQQQQDHDARRVEEELNERLRLQEEERKRLQEEIRETEDVLLIDDDDEGSIETLGDIGVPAPSYSGVVIEDTSVESNPIIEDAPDIEVVEEEIPEDVPSIEETELEDVAIETEEVESEVFVAEPAEQPVELTSEDSEPENIMQPKETLDEPAQSAKPIEPARPEVPEEPEHPNVPDITMGSDVVTDENKVIPSRFKPVKPPVSGGHAPSKQTSIAKPVIDAPIFNPSGVDVQTKAMDNIHITMPSQPKKKETNLDDYFSKFATDKKEDRPTSPANSYGKLPWEGKTAGLAITVPEQPMPTQISDVITKTSSDVADAAIQEVSHREEVNVPTMSQPVSVVPEETVLTDEELDIQRRKKYMQRPPLPKSRLS